MARSPRSRPSARRGLAALPILLATAPAIAAQEPPAQPAPAKAKELRFLDGLRERGYFDLALEYTDQLRQQGADADLAAILDFEEAKGLLQEAEVAPDLARREQIFGLARARLDQFVKDHPDHPEAIGAKILLAQIIFLRGQTEALKATEAPTDAEKEARLKDARSTFAQARAAYDDALVPVQAAYDAFPVGFLEPTDPKRAARDDAHNRLMDTRLKRALVDYEEAQTYPADSPRRSELLDSAILVFKDLHDRYRGWSAGVAARMWQGKSLEEKGDLRAAMGIYKELLDHPDPRLEQLQRQVAFFSIIVTAKRGEHPLAERYAREWLARSRGIRSIESLGVQLELAKSLDAQLAANTIAEPGRQREAREEVVNLAAEVVRIASPYKPAAAELLRKYRPSGGVDPKALANLNADQALEKGREAIGIEDWEAATAYLGAAVRKRDAARQPEKVNESRYLLAFAHYRAGRYYEAAVIASFLASRYPEWDQAAQAAELAMSAMALGYEDVPGRGREQDLDRLDAFARTIEATFAEKDQADVARIIRGDIALGRGRYPDAAAIFESVNGDAKRLDAQGKAAAAHWRQSLVLRKQASADTIPPEAADEATKARALLEKTLEERRAEQTPPTDGSLLANVGDLAEIHVAENRPAEAIALLEPATQAAIAAGAADEAARQLLSRLLKLQLQAHIAAGQSEKAVADMKALEAASTGEPLTQMFFGLGRLLQKEMDDQAAKGNRVALERTKSAYEKFLDALVASESGQSYESLQWAGESMLDVSKPDRALEIFDRVLKDYPAEPRLGRTKLRRVTALRAAGKFPEAWAAIDTLIKANPKGLDYLLERCRLLEDWAKAEKGRWNAAIKYWQELAKMLERQRPRPAEFYECWYHVAWCYQQAGNDDYARRTLKSILALSPTAGTPELKSRYEALLKQIGG